MADTYGNLRRISVFFLKSMLECSAAILDDIQADADMEAKLKFQAELAYLLAQQFIDAGGTLPLIVGEPAAHDDADIYHMLWMPRRYRQGAGGSI